MPIEMQVNQSHKSFHKVLPKIQHQKIEWTLEHLFSPKKDLPQIGTFGPVGAGCSDDGATGGCPAFPMNTTSTAQYLLMCQNRGFAIHA